MSLSLSCSRRFLPLLIAASLTACSTGFEAVTGTFRSAADRVLPESLRSQKQVDEPQLDPRFRYLRATIGGYAAYLVLGYDESDSHGPMQVWYSGTGEVLKLQHGRLNGASGLFTEWRNVDLTRAPSWRDAASSGGPVTWMRVRDVMPGYRYGIKDQMTLRRIEPPRKTALLRVDPSGLVWFEETTATATREAAVPRAVFGVDVAAGEVVYSEQCVAVDFCFTLQRWPVEIKK